MTKKDRKNAKIFTAAILYASALVRKHDPRSDEEIKEALDKKKD